MTSLAVSTEIEDGIIAEEKKAYDTPLDARIHRVPVPMDCTDDDVTRKANKLIRDFGDVFKTKEDCTYFSMLPLSKKDQLDVLTKARLYQSQDRNNAW